MIQTALRPSRMTATTCEAKHERRVSTRRRVSRKLDLEAARLGRQVRRQGEPGRGHAAAAVEQRKREPRTHGQQRRRWRRHNRSSRRLCKAYRGCRRPSRLFRAPACIIVREGDGQRLGSAEPAAAASIPPVRSADHNKGRDAQGLVPLQGGRARAYGRQGSALRKDTSWRANEVAGAIASGRSS